MMNISEYAIRNRRVMWFFLAIMIVGGVYAFIRLGKREDSTFVIKSAVVTCPYPGRRPRRWRGSSRSRSNAASER